MIIGYWHRKNQFSVEAEALFNQNVVGARMYIFLIDLIDGKITEEEKQKMRGYLAGITKGSLERLEIFLLTAAEVKSIPVVSFTPNCFHFLYVKTMPKPMSITFELIVSKCWV